MLGSFNAYYNVWVLQVGWQKCMHVQDMFLKQKIGPVKETFFNKYLGNLDCNWGKKFCLQISYLQTPPKVCCYSLFARIYNLQREWHSLYRRHQNKHSHFFLTTDMAVYIPRSLNCTPIWLVCLLTALE